MKRRGSQRSRNGGKRVKKDYQRQRAIRERDIQNSLIKSLAVWKFTQKADEGFCH
jgi:hypothetical protein